MKVINEFNHKLADVFYSGGAHGFDRDVFFQINSNKLPLGKYILAVSLCIEPNIINKDDITVWCYSKKEINFEKILISNDFEKERYTGFLTDSLREYVFKTFNQ